MTDFLENQTKAFPAHSGLFEKLRDAHQKKLYHQLGKIIVDEVLPVEAFRSGTILIQMYDQFVKKFEKKLNSLQLSQFLIAAARQHTEGKEMVGFLESHASAINEPQANLLLRTEIIAKEITMGEIEKAKTGLEAGKLAMDQYPGIMDTVVYSAYYRAALHFYKATGNAAEYFSNSLLFLTYTPVNSISHREQMDLASNLGLAALTGPTIYNFGELLQQPIIKVLQGSNFEWILQFLQAYNAGDLPRYRELMSSAENKQRDIFVKNADFLSQKMRIMTLLELLFKRGGDRDVAFEDIGKGCEVKMEEVEFLVLKAFSLKVVKGRLDQVNGKLRVDWIQPRVLNNEQISAVSERLKTWSTQLNQSALHLESSGHALFAKEG